MKKTILVVAALVIIVLIAISPVRKAQARHRVDDFEQEHPVDLSFTAAEEIRDRRSFAEELVRLVRWEEAARDRIDQIYKPYIPGNPDRVKDIGQISGYQGEENLNKEVFAARWKELRIELEEETLAGLESIYRSAGNPVPQIPEQNAVKEYYQRDGFYRLCNAVSQAEEGDPAEVFMDRKPGWSYRAGGDEWVCPDLLYLLWPDEIRQGYETRLQVAIDGADVSDQDESIRSLDRTISDAEGLQQRYGCSLSKLDEASTLLQDFRDRRHQERLAEEEARQKAIKEKLDRIYSSHSGTYEDPVDPDDHDLDGYYYDYMDEYDDIDDAWDGFMDDEDAWDDY